MSFTQYSPVMLSLLKSSNATTPPTTFTPSTQNRMHVYTPPTQYHHQKKAQTQTPTSKENTSQNCQRAFQRETPCIQPISKETTTGYHTGAMVGYIPLAVFHFRRNRRNQGNGKGKGGRLVFSVVNNHCLRIFSFLLGRSLLLAHSLHPTFLLLAHSFSTFSAFSASYPPPKDYSLDTFLILHKDDGRMEEVAGMAWLGLDSDLETGRLIDAEQKLHRLFTN